MTLISILTSLGFLAGDRSETWILEGGSSGSFDNRLVKRADWA